MNKFFAFIKRERLYILILIFVALFSAMIFNYPAHKGKQAKRARATAEEGRKDREKRFDEESALRKAGIEETLHKDERLAALFALVTLLIAALLLMGLIIDAATLAAIFGRKFDIRTLSPPAAAWGLWDVCKVVMLFMFFGYIILISEAFWSRVLPALKSENVRMILNTSVLDILAATFIIYFTVVQYGAKLYTLGLSAKNILRNILYGVTAYIALIPVLLAILAATAVVINITKYIPAKQPVVELLLKEKNTGFVLYSSLFAAVAGPFIEELFFRGFMYGAVKKYIGALAAAVVTSLIFAGLHAHVVGFFPIVALGLMLAYLYEKTGTLVSSITLHMIHNLSMVFLVFLIKTTGAG